MSNSEYFFITYLAGAFIFAIIFFILMPIFSYKHGKKINKAGSYGSLSLALGGSLFFAYMMAVAYLESGPFNTHSGMDGVIPVVISLIGVAAIIIGLIWRLIVSIKGSKVIS